MLVKIKNFKKKSEHADYLGLEGFNIPEGGIVEVLRESVANKGDIIIRTDNMEHPFRTLKSSDSILSDLRGAVWGNRLEGYYFRHWKYRNEEDFKK